MQKGGDVFSLDTWYGYATGMYDFSAANNELGNPVRDLVQGTPGNYLPTDGGVILPGVAPDGTNNTVRANANIYANVRDIYSWCVIIYRVHFPVEPLYVADLSLARCSLCVLCLCDGLAECCLCMYAIITSATRRLFFVGWFYSYIVCNGSEGGS